LSKRTFLTLKGGMVHPTRPPAALSIIASSLLAFGVVAVGEGGLGDDPRRPSPVLTRPAARVVVPLRNADPPLAQQFLDIDSAPRRSQPNTIPVLAPGPQSVPVPGPSTGETAAPAPEPPPSEPVPTPEIVPLPPPDTQVLDPVVALIGGLLGAGSEEAGTEAPTSTVTGLLGL
jgi:hypothetical protein